jgi:outer membrane protein assembly factor BamB
MRKKRMRCIVVLVIALFSLVSVTRADDWPQFRGPRRDATFNETGLLASFPADGLAIKWRRPVGRGWSSPVVADGRVFVTHSVLMKPLAKERIQCFDEATGNPLWNYDYDIIFPDWSFEPGGGGPPCPTPIVDGGKIYTAASDGHLHCLVAETGALVWQKEIEKEYKIKQLSCRPSPLIDGNLFIVFTGATPGASMMALDKESGKEVWKSLEDGISNTSPIVVDAGGARQLIVWTADSVASLNPATGAVYWRDAMVTSTNDCIPTPVVQGRRLLIGGLMMELSGDAPSAKVVWPVTTNAAKRILSNTSTAVVVDDYVYSAKSNGEFVCLDAATGNQVWETDTVTAKRGGASIHITLAGEHAYLFSDQGDLILARLNPKAYTEISRTHLLEPTTPFGGSNHVWPPPAFANRHVYVRNDEEVVCASLIATP